MSAPKQSLHLATGQSEASKRRATLLTQCRVDAQKRLSELVRKLYDQVDDSLFELAQKAENNTIQSLYFDAMREVRLRREAFTRTYAEQFSNNYQSCCVYLERGQTASDSSIIDSTTGLSLVEEDDLEEKIAISSLITKVQHHFALPLAELACRYAYLLGGDELQAEQQPLSPRIITETFQSACSVFDVPLKVKLILYKLLDKYLMTNLQAFYDEINHLLIKEGVFPNGIPNLNTIKKKNSAATESPSETSFDQLCGLLNSGQGGGGSSTASHHYSPSSAIPYLSDDIVAALNQLQPSGLQGGLPLNSSLLTTLQHLPNMLSNGAIGQQEQNAIDLIEMIFDFIYEDEELSDYLKSTVARLQIPLLKVAILDKQFFSDQHHPARALLNEFTQASFVGDSKKVEEKIESLVNQIINEFSSDLSLFSTVLDDFHDFMFNEQQLHIEEQQSELKKAELRELRAKNTIIVDEEIARHMPEHALPELLQTFIDEVWRELMINTYMESGADSPAWKIHLQLTEDLLWSVTPKTSKEERGYLTQMIPYLVQILGESLEKTNWDKSKIDALFEELGDCHIGALRGESANAEYFEPPAKAEEPPIQQPEAEIKDPLHQRLLRELEEIEHEEIILDESGIYSQLINSPDKESSIETSNTESHTTATPSTIDEEPSSTTDYYDERVAELKLGDWVEFSDDGKNLLKARLVWHGEVDGEFIFENWRHEIVRRCNREELATKLRNWDVRILNTVPIMERALTSVMGMLSERRGAEEKHA